MTDPHYKRGTIRKDGKLYGRYPDDRSTASTPSPTDRSFSWWIERARRSFAYAKLPSRAIPIVPVLEPPT